LITTRGERMAKIQLNQLCKVYEGNVKAVSNVNLQVDDEEFIVFVGPSGCGKSTTLRMIAGLEEISSGEFLIDGKRMNEVQPKDRDIAMVFQNYALYPHMTVYDNMAFSLKLRKTPKDEIKKRVEEAARILDLEPYLHRKPKALSGGQRQRVALGRAIVRDAKVFLMDEPLSNLDAKLRFQMRSEITKLHHRLKTTTIYVTHDQTEAMTMATRIVIMKDGVIQQVGTPKEVYGEPANKFVGSFIGSPAMNFFDCELIDGSIKIGQTLLNPTKQVYEKLQAKGYENKPFIFGIRPEHINVVNPSNLSEGQNFPVQIEVAELTGAETLLYATNGGQNLVARVETDQDFRPGDSVALSFQLEHVHFFDAETENRIHVKWIV
jgi:multiple sugar transport system ATP-binding protein